MRRNPHISILKMYGISRNIVLELQTYQYHFCSLNIKQSLTNIHIYICKNMYQDLLYCQGPNYDLETYYQFEYSILLQTCPVVLIVYFNPLLFIYTLIPGYLIVFHSVHPSFLLLPFLAGWWLLTCLGIVVSFSFVLFLSLLTLHLPTISVQQSQVYLFP